MTPQEPRAPELRAEQRMVGGAPAAPPADATAAPPRPAPPRRKRGWFLGTIFFLVKAALVLVVAGGLAAGGAGYALYRSVAADLPDYSWLADYHPPQMSRVYAADSRLMAELAQERRVFVPIEAIPQRIQQAFVAAEDQNFWHHRGVDPVAIARAVMVNVEQLGSGRRPIGASTITQQVAKNMLVGADRTSGKIQTFRLDRMSAVRAEDGMAAPPPDFDLQAFAARSFGIYQDEVEDVVLHLGPEGAAEARAWRWHPTQTLEDHPDGSVTVRFTASGMRELAWHLFTWGDQVSIQAPDRLREVMAAELAAAQAALAGK
jgi:hypothetical protein